MDEPYQPVYFIGIALPPDLDRQIAELKWQLYDKKAGMLKPLLPHVTLLHPPSLKGIMPSELIPRVRKIAERYLPMTIELTEIGFFGKQVCYLRAESFKLYSLQQQLVKLLPPEAQALHYKRPYLPHITIAQKYEPKILQETVVREAVKDSIKLPVRFETNSVSCFTRIFPRQYHPEPIP